MVARINYDRLRAGRRHAEVLAEMLAQILLRHDGDVRLGIEDVFLETLKKELGDAVDQAA